MLAACTARVLAACTGLGAPPVRPSGAGRLYGPRLWARRILAVQLCSSLWFILVAPLVVHPCGPRRVAPPVTQSTVTARSGGQCRPTRHEKALVAAQQNTVAASGRGDLQWSDLAPVSLKPASPRANSRACSRASPIGCQARRPSRGQASRTSPPAAPQSGPASILVPLRAHPHLTPGLRHCR